METLEQRSVVMINTMKKLILSVITGLFINTLPAGFCSNFASDVNSSVYGLEINEKNLPELIDKLFNNYPNADDYKHYEICFTWNIMCSDYTPEWAQKCLERLDYDFKIKAGTEYAESLKNVIRILLVAFDGNNPSKVKREHGYQKRVEILKYITKQMVENSLSNKEDLTIVNNKLYGVLNYFFGYVCASYVAENIDRCTEEFGVPYSENTDPSQKKEGIRKLFDTVWEDFGKTLSAIKLSVEGGDVLSSILRQYDEKDFKELIYHDWFCYFIQTGALTNRFDKHTSLLSDIVEFRMGIVETQKKIIETLSNEELNFRGFVNRMGKINNYDRGAEAQIEQKCVEICEEIDMPAIVANYNEKISEVGKIIKPYEKRYEYGEEIEVKKEEKMDPNNNNSRSYNRCLWTFKSEKIKSNIVPINNINEYHYLGVLNDIGVMKKAMENVNKIHNTSLLDNNDNKSSNVTKRKDDEKLLDIKKIVDIYLNFLKDDIFLICEEFNCFEFKKEAQDRNARCTWQGKTFYSVFDTPKRLIENYYRCCDKNISVKEFERIVSLYSKLVKLTFKSKGFKRGEKKVEEYLCNCSLTTLAVALFVIEQSSDKEIDIDELVDKIIRFSMRTDVKDEHVLCALLCYITNVQSSIKLSKKSNNGIDDIEKEDYLNLLDFFEKYINKINTHFYKNYKNISSKEKEKLSLLGNTMIMKKLVDKINQIKGDAVSIINNLDSILYLCEEYCEDILETKAFQQFVDKYLSHLRSNNSDYLKKHFIKKFLLDILSYELFKDLNLAFDLDEHDENKYPLSINDETIKQMTKDFLKIIFEFNKNFKIEINENQLNKENIFQILGDNENNKYLLLDQ